MTLMRHGRCSCGASADLEISPEGWNASPPWFELTTLCKGKCPTRHGTLSASEVEVTGWRYDGAAVGWSRLTERSADGWSP